MLDMQTNSQSLSSRSITLENYSVGVGDRFGHQGPAQLRAFEKAASDGIYAVPVWNKSNREHKTIGSKPESVRAAAEAAVANRGWTGGFHVDADHINLATVDGFLESCDFFTIDVADAIGKNADGSSVREFISRHPELLKKIELPGTTPLKLAASNVEQIAHKYLFAVKDAGAIYRRIVSAKGAGTFITEVSMDETDLPQTPEELLVILAALADEQVPLQTIAPKFTGRFNKGVDYVGDLEQFEREFRADIAVIGTAVEMYGLPTALKLSVHSGSDKVSIYPAIRKALQETGAGLHLKTAGTTWLEEIIGLAESGGEALEVAKDIYASAYDHREELCAPYATVIDIRIDSLPTPATVRSWNSEQYVRSLRHDQSCNEYNPSLRQLLHVGYKIAAQMGARYLNMLSACEETIAKNVTENIYKRHLLRVFLPQSELAVGRNAGAQPTTQHG